MGEVININTITEEELSQLSGIGKVKATAIVEHRNIHSEYTSIEDLKCVKGVTSGLIVRLLLKYTFDFTSGNHVDKGRKCRAKRQTAAENNSSDNKSTQYSTPPRKKRCMCTDRISGCQNDGGQSDNEPKTPSCANSVCDRLCGTPSTSTSRCLTKSNAHNPTVSRPAGVESWLSTFDGWKREERLSALNDLISGCDMSVVRHMMAKIQPHFQRDFIAFLPKELSLYILSFLDPKDLCRAAKTCRYWRTLTEDNLLWREKCLEYDVFCSLDDFSFKPLENTASRSSSEQEKPFKQQFLYSHKLEMNWRRDELKCWKFLRGHDDHVVTCLEFDGVRIISGSDDNTLKVWCAVTGNLIRTLLGHTGGVWSSHLKDNIVVSGSTDRTLRVWNCDTGECTHVLQGHTSTVRCLDMHLNTIVSGSRDGTLRVWDVVEGTCLHVLIGHAAAVRCVQYDGVRVVSGAYDFLVKVWDVETEVCSNDISMFHNLKVCIKSSVMPASTSKFNLIFNLF